MSDVSEHLRSSVATLAMGTSMPSAEGHTACGGRRPTPSFLIQTKSSSTNTLSHRPAGGLREGGWDKRRKRVRKESCRAKAACWSVKFHDACRPCSQPAMLTCSARNSHRKRSRAAFLFLFMSDVSEHLRSSVATLAMGTSMPSAEGHTACGGRRPTHGFSKYRTHPLFQKTSRSLS